MKLQKSLVLGFLLALLALAPAFGQTTNPDEELDKEPGVKFLDSSEAWWHRRSINDSIYKDYTVNGVFNERAQVRLGQEFHLYKKSEVKLGKVEPVAKGPAPNYSIKMNGKVVQVKE